MTTDSNPIAAVMDLLDKAIASGVQEPTAVCLATANVEGAPSARMMLLKGIDPRGFVIFTNLESRKADELASNPRAALVFFWAEIGRQVRIEGEVEQVSEQEADEYFSSRPRGSQIGAWASRQSHALSRREELLQAVTDTERRYDGMPVPRPPFWSGYRVLPRRIEIWTAHAHRLHEREIFEREPDGSWRKWLAYP
jgi:pyridoxamine 5'-phosphate oxidase